MVIEYLAKEIDELDMANNRNARSMEEIMKKSPFNWTGTKVEAVELIYALKHSGVINMGNVNINELAKYFGLLFNIDDLRIYKTFMEIKGREKPAAFMEQLRDCIIKLWKKSLK